MGVCSSLSVFIPLSVFTRIDPTYLPKMPAEFAERADLEEATHDEPPQLDLHCLSSSTVKILCIGTDRSQQTMQTKIRLLEAV